MVVRYDTDSSARHPCLLDSQATSSSRFGGQKAAGTELVSAALAGNIPTANGLASITYLVKLKVAFASAW